MLVRPARIALLQRLVQPPLRAALSVHIAPLGKHPGGYLKVSGSIFFVPPFG